MSANKTVTVTAATHTPVEAAHIALDTGIKKARLKVDVLFIKSFLGGCLLAMGGQLSDLVAMGSPGLMQSNPGMVHLIAGFVFPLGLIFIVLTGMELFTANVMYLTIAYLEGQCTLLQIANNWFVSFFGNLAGSLFYMAILTYYAGELTTSPYKEALAANAVAHVATPGWHEVFLRGIACNWLVGLSVWLGNTATDMVSKIYGIHMPIWIFVAIGYDHVIANMYTIPLGIKDGSTVSTSYYIWKNMIPSLIGNIVGGMLFIGLPFWYLNFYSDRRDQKAATNKSEIGAERDLNRDSGNFA